MWLASLLPLSSVPSINRLLPPESGCFIEGTWFCLHSLPFLDNEFLSLILRFLMRPFLSFLTFPFWSQLMAGLGAGSNPA